MTEPSLDAAIEGAGKLEGWAFFEHPADPGKQAAELAKSEQAENAAAHLARLHASDPAFRAAIDLLLDMTLRRATFVAHLGLDPMQAYGYGVFREGQNSLMTVILNMIARGRKDRPEPGRE